MPSKPRDPNPDSDPQLPFDPDPSQAGEESAVTAGNGEGEAVPAAHAHPMTAVTGTVTPRNLHHVGEMYGNWFLDYASYVILERAVPHLNDGLKPVQRRILHTMETMDDGRFNKVANIVGETMKYHPHGDSAITEALVGIGQKDLMVETQGNWGNIFTGDDAAAARYIEARLSKFALEVAFNGRLTTWAASYDGRNKEPVTLPMKFPLLLAQGVEGIAVGLSCKILPHNFNELCDAAIDALRNKKVNLLPDFPTGALMDATDYNEGLRGGKIKVRARITKVKKGNTLQITEIPFGTTTTGLIESILAANEKGKIKIARVEDCTAEKVDIIVHLSPGTDADEMMNALYVFTDCEVSISPNSVVILDDKPVFLSVNDLLKHSANQTRDLLRQELEMKLNDLEEKWHLSSLEKIFIEKRIYRDIEECTTWEAVMAAIWKGLKPYLKLLRREVTDEDVAKLTEIKIKRISKYNSFEADEHIRSLEKQIEETKGFLAELTKFTINWFKELKRKYGGKRERRTEITTFGAALKASEVAVATETLYVNREDGYVGWGLKRTGDPVCKCSRYDDIIVFLEDGTVKVSKVSEKAMFGPRPPYVGIFDREKIFSIIYRDGARGRYYAKRFQMGGVTRDTFYDLTKGTKGSKLVYFAAHNSPETSAKQRLMIHYQPAPRLRKLEEEFDFSTLEIKSRSANGNIIAENPVKRFTLVR
ncbi:MAG TPA: DNA gyrase/topoisomerase IV subunit A [Verrucomicrobiales bacterium]|nr:DNA gyrase/topoisomerase IV subunit A [Verrucomicrobiales bacterium]